MKDKSFNFPGAKFTIKVLTSETGNKYTILDVVNPPNLRPSLNMHPNGSETFYIVEGNYDFILDEKSITTSPGDLIFVPPETPHRFVVWGNEGHTIVISPPHQDFYFFKVNCLTKGKFHLRKNP